MFILKKLPLTGTPLTLYRSCIIWHIVRVLYNLPSQDGNLTLFRFLSLHILTRSCGSENLIKVRLFSPLSKNVLFCEQVHLFEWRGKHHTDGRYSVVMI